MIKLKDKSVVVFGLTKEMYYAAGTAACLLQGMYGHDLLITSALDGKHNPGSLHPKGNAIDIRIKMLTDLQAHQYHTALKAHLYSQGFDVIFEGGVGATPATTGAHIHIEYDPKPGRQFWPTV